LSDSIGVKEPIFSTSLGLIKYSFKRKFNYFIEYNNVDTKKGKAKGNSNRNIFSLFKKMWEEYF
jgi:cell division protein FtsA